MTKAELETQIGYRIRTSSRNFITADEITAELNRSLDRLNGMVDLFPTIQTTTIAFTGDGNYNLPSDFKSAIDLFDRSNNMRYKMVTKDELYEIEDGAAVSVVSGTQLITPTNSYAITLNGSSSTIDIESVVSSATLTLTYYSTYDAKTSGGTKQKALSNSTDEPLLQPRFHDYFVEDVAAILFRKERKYEDYQFAVAERERIMDRIFDANQTYEERVVTLVEPINENWD